MQLRELDWYTPAGAIKIGSHGRILLCQLLATIAATAMWNAYSPNTFWFSKFWMGAATGSLVGLIVGGYWQLRSPKRRSFTSGKFLALSFTASVAFTSISVFLMAPDLDSQERERAAIRSLSAADISELSVQIDGRSECRIKDAASIASLTALTRHAELFYPSHEGSTLKFQLVIHCSNGAVLEYNGGIREHHQHDISLSFRGYFTWSDIIIPDGRQWLDAVVRPGLRRIRASWETIEDPPATSHIGSVIEACFGARRWN